MRYAANPSTSPAKSAVDALIFAITRTPTCACRSCAAANARSPCRRSRWTWRARNDASLKVEQTPAFVTAFGRPQYLSIRRWTIPRCARRSTWPSTAPATQAVFEGSASRHRHLSAEHLELCRDIPAYPHAPEQARKLLAGKQPELNIWTRPSGSLLNPNPSLGAQLLQADLAEAGIKANIRRHRMGAS